MYFVCVSFNPYRRFTSRNVHALPILSNAAIPGNNVCDDKDLHSEDLKQRDTGLCSWKPLVSIFTPLSIDSFSKSCLLHMQEKTSLLKNTAKLMSVNFIKLGNHSGWNKHNILTRK